ncbi:MAG TPA: DNA polymerase ligase N-terminal domain-containing protein [Candidatus Paceibacterota bacterium]|nr:DNA polymerase ligase N-terminal domain-containing protein [Candidatus Paceibacterota bacterium]
MGLARYNQKRDFKKTPEPIGRESATSKNLSFVVQKHDATQLHYDLRLQMKGVMKSWAVPKGPSMTAGVKRLAMQVEDHPISYNSFEGHIPKGQYGGGDVIVWDKGTYYSLSTPKARESEKEFLQGLKKGKLTFILQGTKLKGEFHMFRFNGEKNWMLVKAKDEFDSIKDVTSDPRSVKSKKMLIGRREDTQKYLKRIKSKLKFK